MTDREKNIIAHLISKTKMMRKTVREYAGFGDRDMKPVNDAIAAAEKLIGYFEIKENLTSSEIE